MRKVGWNASAERSSTVSAVLSDTSRVAFPQHQGPSRTASDVCAHVYVAQGSAVRPDTELQASAWWRAHLSRRQQLSTTRTWSVSRSTFSALRRLGKRGRPHGSGPGILAVHLARGHTVRCTLAFPPSALSTSRSFHKLVAGVPRHDSVCGTGGLEVRREATSSDDQANFYLTESSDLHQWLRVRRTK